MTGFRLATLERLREKNVQVAARVLHEASKERAEAGQHRQEMAHALANSAPVLTTTPDQMVQAATYRDVLRDQIAEAGVEIERLEGLLVQAREAWVQANAQLRAVVALHDRYRAAKRKQLEKLEQQETDERAGNQAARTGDPAVDLDDPALHDPTGVVND